MSWTQRMAAERPPNPVNVMHEATAKAWQASTAAAFQAGTSAADTAGWAFHNPFEAMERMYDGTRDAALTRWNKLRDFYGAGSMAWNAIVNLEENTCAGKYGVAIDLALPIAGNIMAILLTPSPAEILEEYLDPKQSRGRRGRREADREKRRRRGKSGRRRRSFGGPPDVDAMTASIIPGAAAMQARNAFAPTRWFFTGIAIADLDAITWMLVDLTSDGLVQWSSGMNQARFCSAGFNVAIVSDQNVPFEGVNYTFGEATLDPDQGQRMLWNGDRLVYDGTPGVNAQLSGIWAATVRNASGTQVAPNVKLDVRVPGVRFSSETTDLQPGETRDFVVETPTFLMAPQEFIIATIQHTPAISTLAVSQAAVSVGGFAPPP